MYLLQNVCKANLHHYLCLFGMRGLFLVVCFFGVRCAWHKYFGFSTTFTVHPAMLSDGQSTLLHHTVPASRKQPFYRWELNRSDIEMGQGLGMGLFGTVYKALLKGKTTVAVKRFKVRYEHMLTI